jgi:hypothetical protein
MVYPPRPGMTPRANAGLRLQQNPDVGSDIQAPLRRLFRRLLGRFLSGLFCGARAGKDAGHSGIIAFVAGILVDELVALAHRNDSGPRMRPYGRIIDRELVDERFGRRRGRISRRHADSRPRSAGCWVLA